MRTQLDTGRRLARHQVPKIKAMRLEANEEMNALADVTPRRWKQIQSTDPLELVYREIKSITDEAAIGRNDRRLRQCPGQRRARRRAQAKANRGGAGVPFL
ncbi:hypothetical protein [Streptomyces griseorubiginosus]|uniref:hypothetical protein n=1 Tax=Streptomyces griseorubiginosus TaxID=67304 RepID=UPI0036E7ACF9